MSAIYNQQSIWFWTSRRSQNNSGVKAVTAIESKYGLCWKETVEFEEEGWLWTALLVTATQWQGTGRVPAAAGEELERGCIPCDPPGQ